ncbi:ribosome modulation factor [Tsukamurella asaccharolytica]|uniref:ribosome modulation factor n=1 Tax=Tsukamurella asaccharolytica TaxID=2592067 RepID=UPI00140AFFD4|nr:hypothetical protein [Tsukamurella asaccharolytica]
MTVIEILNARRAGLVAEPGTSNPYDGNITPVLAQMWRAGYRQMLADRLATSPARQAYLSQRHLSQPRDPPVGVNAEPVTRRRDR